MQMAAPALYMCWNREHKKPIDILESIPGEDFGSQPSGCAPMEGGRASGSRAGGIRSVGEELMAEIGRIKSSAGHSSSVSTICRISKVYALARNVVPSEYDAHFISIGPYHRSPSLEYRKLLCLDQILQRGGSRTVDDYLQEMAMLEGAARNCYDDRFDMTSEEFARMLLLDGCFILVTFGNDALAPGGGSKLEDAPVVRDVFYLAENQIPLFVVEKIHQLSTNGSGTSAASRIAAYALELLKEYRHGAMPEMTPAPSHLLHLLHMHLMPTQLPPAAGGMSQSVNPVGRWHTAMEYFIAGVNFRKRDFGGTNATGCILDVRLSGSTLEVPCLKADNETWRILRNLMALEQRNPAIDSHVTAYCVFMSQIACTGDDVAHLSKQRIVVHLQGNHGEAAKMFSDLCKGIVFDVDDPNQNYLLPLCEELEGRYGSVPRNWMALLYQKYLSNPWVAIALLAAAIQLTCSVVQAIYSVLSVTKG